MNNLIGRILLNRYQIETFIGSGIMGTVFRARDFKRNTWLAVKVLNEDLADDPSIFKQFRREARALERLAHPRIVPFYGLYRDEEVNFLLEGYIDGPTLKKLLQQRKGQPLPLSEALSFLKVLCSALGYAHANGVVHCDVKPGNVILDQGGNIYLADFGIVRHAGSTTTTLISAGTPAYMSPEQIRGDFVTPATDIYALGILMFELLTGIRPFRGAVAKVNDRNSTPAERIRQAHLHQSPPDPCLLNPELPRPLANVILKAIEKEPGKRFASAQEFLRDALLAVGVSEESISERIHTIPPDSSTPRDDHKPKHTTKIRLILASGIILSIIIFLVISNTWPPKKTLNAGTATAQTGELAVPPAALGEESTKTVTPAFPESTPESPIQATIAQVIPIVTQQFTTLPSPFYSPLPTSPSLLLQENSFCRGGPGIGYDKIWTFNSGNVLDIVGKDGDWWLVQFDDPRTRHKQCWVNGSIGTVSGDVNSVPLSDYRTSK